MDAEDCFMRVKWVSEEIECTPEELISAIECNITHEEIKAQIEAMRGDSK